ncbi:DUF456 domain-containing protein [Nocardioides jishulii]|uniref:DUF456 domain-containing protein n=1 Tax=Nocardioides jishulii TaxID=2575440 RepID=A0A4U2YM99_9ACTN|nr:DUF456 domain-containing protein [Nocardioides jishulii]QCX27239.1 DUF456 family protein [Nocardioides jishulii]TKI61725.1 DUF456 domain-containing protein [Nocardioides jishulii]
MTLTNVLVGAAIAIGLVGIVVPVLPGSLLVGGAVLAWAIVHDAPAAWVVFAVAATFLVAGTVVKFLVPGRRLQTAGVPSSTLWFGAALGIVGFFVVPVVGLFLGFPLGVYLAEYRRLGPERAWPATKGALRAVGLSILIELVAAVLAALTWGVGLVLV